MPQKNQRLTMITWLSHELSFLYNFLEYWRSSRDVVPFRRSSSLSKLNIPDKTKLLNLNLGGFVAEEYSATQWAEVFESLSHCTNLQKLSLREQNLGELSLELQQRFCQALAQMKALVVLDLDDTHLENFSTENWNSFCQALRQCTKLQELQIGENDFVLSDGWDIFFEALTHCTELRVLNLGGCKLNNLSEVQWGKWILFLKNNENLVSLSYFNNGLTDDKGREIDDAQALKLRNKPKNLTRHPVLLDAPTSVETSNVTALTSYSPIDYSERVCWNNLLSQMPSFSFAFIEEILHWNELRSKQSQEQSRLQNNFKKIKNFISAHPSKHASCILSGCDLGTRHVSEWGVFCQTIGESKQLTSLNLMGNGLDNLKTSHWELLGIALATCGSLIKIDFGCNNLSALNDEQWSAFCYALSQSAHLSELNLGGNNLNSLSEARINVLLRHLKDMIVKGLKKVDFSSDHLNSKYIKIIYLALGSVATGLKTVCLLVEETTVCESSQRMRRSRASFFQENTQTKMSSSWRAGVEPLRKGMEQLLIQSREQQRMLHAYKRKEAMDEERKNEDHIIQHDDNLKQYYDTIVRYFSSLRTAAYAASSGYTPVTNSAKVQAGKAVGKAVSSIVPFSGAVIGPASEVASLLDIKQRKQFLNATITRWSSNTQESEKLIDLLARFLIRLHVHSKQALSQKKAEEDAKIITKIISTSGLASILTETSVEAIVKNFWGDAPYNLAPLVETVATETCGLRM